MVTLTARPTPQACNEEGRPTTERPTRIFNDYELNSHSNSAKKPQPFASNGGTLTVAKGPAVDMLRMAAFAFSYGDLVGAQRFYEKMMLARSAWLAANQKRLPDPDWLDRQRYGRQQRKEAAHG